MLAYVLEGVGRLERKVISKPSANGDWVVVKVQSCGICSSDIPRIFKTGTYHFPTIPGHEFSGIVVETSEEQSHLLNKRVGVFPLIPCNKCEQCSLKNYEMCSNYDYLGSRRDGGFAEYVLVPAWNLIEMPENIPFEIIALMEPLSVAMSAVRKASILCSESVAVIGTGMIGISAAYFSKLFTKDVTIIGRNEEKRRLISPAMDIEYLYRNIENDKYDNVLEAVGTIESITQAINATKPGGTLILMGNPAGDIVLEKKVYWKILRKQLRIIGTWNSKFDGKNESDWTEVRRFLIEGRADFSSLISHRFDSEHLIDALSLMKNHLEPYCKVMINWKKG